MQLSTGMPYAIACSIGSMAATRSAITKGKRVGAVAAPQKRRPRAEMPPVEPSTIGGRLRICRDAAGLTQRAAAGKLGIKPQSLGGLEHGGSKAPSAETLWRMRDKLHYDPEYVMRGKNVPLMPNFEELAKEMALISIFRDLQPQSKKSLIGIAQGLRRAEGKGPSKDDPFNHDPPGADD